MPGIPPTSFQRRRYALFETPEYRSADESAKANMRNALENKFEAEISARQEQFRQESEESGVTGKIGRSLASGIISAGNRMTFGAIPRVVGEFAPGEQQRFDIANEARIREYPISSLVGDVSGFFAPGPLRATVGGAGRLVSGPLAKLASKDALAGNVLARTIAQIGANATGGAAAIGTATLTDLSSDESLPSRLRTVVDSLNPTTRSGIVNYGLSVAFGVPQGIARQRVDAAAANAIAEAKRVLGPKFTASPDLARPEGSLGVIFARIANLPGGRGIARRFLRKAVYEPIDQALNNMKASLGPRVSESRGARAARSVSSRIERTRRGINKPAFEKEGGIYLSEETQNVLISSVKTAVKDLSYQDRARVNRAVGGAIGRFMKTVSGAKKNGQTVTNQDVEDFRMALSSAGKLATKEMQALSDVDQRIVGSAYRAISETFRQSGPEIYQAHKAAEFLHGLRTLMPNAKLHDTEDVLMAHFKGGDVVSRFKVIERFASSQEVQAIRGWYLAKWIQTVTPKDGGTRLINMPTMLNQFRSKTGMFRESVFDAVLPGMRRDFEAIGTISHEVQKGAGAAAGSPTAAGLVVAGGIGSIISAASLLGYVLIGDPELSDKSLKLLGSTGSAIVASVLVNKAFGSTLGGRIGTQLNRAALGQPLFGPTNTAAAANVATQALTGQQGVQR